MRHAFGRGSIPSSESFQQAFSQGAAKGPIRPAFEISITPFPGVAHGCEAIANMGDARRRLHGLGHAVAQADDEIDVLDSPPGAASGMAGSKWR